MLILDGITPGYLNTIASRFRRANYWEHFCISVLPPWIPFLMDQFLVGKGIANQFSLINSHLMYS